MRPAPHSPVVKSRVVWHRHRGWRVPDEASSAVLRRDARNLVEEVALDEHAAKLVLRGRDVRLGLGDAEEDAEDHTGGLVDDAEVREHKRVEGDAMVTTGEVVLAVLRDVMLAKDLVDRSSVVPGRESVDDGDVEEPRTSRAAVVVDDDIAGQEGAFAWVPRVEVHDREKVSHVDVDSPVDARLANRVTDGIVGLVVAKSCDVPARGEGVTCDRVGGASPQDVLPSEREPALKA